MHPTPGSAGSTPTAPADIEITDDMIRAAGRAIDPTEDILVDDPEDANIARGVLQAVAPLIGAAYLRWLTTYRVFVAVQDELQALANELDGEAQR